MITPKIDLKEVQTGFKIFYLRRDRSAAILSGKAREYARLTKEHAKVCVDNFELSKRVEFPTIDKIPLFSIFGFNVMKVSLCELFRPKTMKEIMYRKMLWAEEKQKEFAKLFSKS